MKMMMLLPLILLLVHMISKAVRNRHRKRWYHLLFTAFLTLLQGMAVMVAWFYIEKVYLQKMAALFGVILVAIDLAAELNQRYLQKTYEESATEYQNRMVKRQAEEVENIYSTMRGWRHDYHNHMQSLKAYLKAGQISEAKAYLDMLESDLEEVDQLIKTGNVNVDAILNSKISMALKERIAVNYKAVVPKNLTISEIDMCVLIGNLLDNAMEACEQMKGEKTFIRIYIGMLKGQLYISVSNSTNEMVRKFDEQYISMKRGNHGHGLKRINYIVKKYDGYINRKNEPGVFVTEVLLPL